jgi:hypothetical protein
VQNPKLRYFKPFELFDHTGGAGGDLGLDRTGRFALRGQIEFINFRTNHNFSPDSNTGAVRLSVGVVFRIGTNK